MCREIVKKNCKYLSKLLKKSRVLTLSDEIPFNKFFIKDFVHILYLDPLL